MKIAAIVFLVLIAAVLIVAATRPSAFRIQRAVTIEAPPEQVYRCISDFHRWRSWSPWEKLDPAMKRTYTGAEQGEGAGYAWESQGKAGMGHMEITSAVPDARITIRLEFLKPFQATNTAEFVFNRAGPSTTVTWAMFGQRPCMMKLMSLFLDMDKMVGGDFETGLANLKALAEQPQARVTAIPVNPNNFPATGA